MTRLRVSVLLLFSVLVFFVLGLWVGVREGSKLALLVEQAPRGVIAIKLLSAARDGKPERMKNILELYVDQGLVGAHGYLQSPLRPFFESPVRPYLGLLWELDPNSYIEQYTIELANYRKNNPSPIPAYLAELESGYIPSDKAFAEETAKRRRENARIINLMVERYAAK